MSHHVTSPAARKKYMTSRDHFTMMRAKAPRSNPARSAAVSKTSRSNFNAFERGKFSYTLPLKFYPEVALANQHKNGDAPCLALICKFYLKLFTTHIPTRPRGYRSFGGKRVRRFR